MLASSMLKKLLTFLGHSTESAASHGADDVTLSAAVLMIYAAQLDGSLDTAEHATVSELLRQRFHLDEAAASDLIRDATQRAGEIVDLYTLTRDIKDTFSLEERISIIEMLWEVVYADGVAHDFETNLVRRVSGLLYVSDVESGAARKRVTDRLGIDVLSPE